MFKKAVIECYNDTSVKTEILFNIASTRASGSKLLRLDFINKEKMSNFRHNMKIMLSLLREIKLEGRIVCYATERTFEKMKLEAEFLYNKYESFIDLSKESEDVVFVYILV